MQVLELRESYASTIQKSGGKNDDGTETNTAIFSRQTALSFLRIRKREKIQKRT
jgi:hypothetical protein